MDWKIKRDSYYSELYEQHGKWFIETAGFLYDSYPDEHDFKDAKNIICTHIPKNLKDNSVILLTTGAFCPFHEGHLDMMLLAKKALEKKGKHVAAGYISPSHDEYVLKKIPNSYNIYERIVMIEEKIKKLDWLFVDPWEGMFTKYTLNFTDVIERLEDYIEHHTGKKIPIYFVSGSDNARFSFTFMNKGYCVIVKRPGFNYDAFQRMVKTDRVLWVEGNNTESSTNIRERGIEKFEKQNAFIRKENFHPLENELIDLFKPHLNKIEVGDFNEQLEVYKHIKPKDNTPVVSIDRLIDGDVNMQLSRKYTVFGSRKLGYHFRGFKGNMDFESCYLFDDDIFTGGTIRYASGILHEKGKKIKAVFTLKAASDMEVIDCRDFLIGHPDGGLFVDLPNGKISRVPYIYPFICPYLRASVFSPMLLSVKAWKLNQKHFNGSNLKVKDFPTIKEALLCSGFDREELMENVCEFYIKFLENLL